MQLTPEEGETLVFWTLQRRSAMILHAVGVQVDSPSIDLDSKIHNRYHVFGARVSVDREDRGPCGKHLSCILTSFQLASLPQVGPMSAVPYMVPWMNFRMSNGQYSLHKQGFVGAAWDVRLGIKSFDQIVVMVASKRAQQPPIPHHHPHFRALHLALYD